MGFLDRLRSQSQSDPSGSGTAVAEPTFHSRHGGLWTDRSDAGEELDRRIAAGTIPEDLRGQLTHWIDQGFVVLEGAVPAEVCEQIKADLDNAFEHGDERLRIQKPGDIQGEPLRAGAPKERARVVDIYWYYESARKALFAKPLAGFLRTVFDEDPLLFQSLTFEKGSEQAIHQDTAYVVVNEPVSLAAAWIALEDVVPGSGELEYYEGSHRLPEYEFGDGRKHWDPQADGDAPHAEWARLLIENSEKMGLKRARFLPKRGDVLIWSADLAHGGSPVTDPDATRRSLVGHYCPVSARPHYYEHAPNQHTQRDGPNSGHFSTFYYAP